MRVRWQWKRSKTVAALLAVGLIGVAGTVAFSSATPGSATADPEPRAAEAARPNIVFILTDDLSKNLVKYMSTVRAMKKRGTTFSNYFVSDSLCCPSRSNILTGRYPHNTKVLVNPNGADAFVEHNNHRRTYAVALDKHYRTAFVGKYLNGHNVGDPVPPGWNEWHMSGNGYAEMPKKYNVTAVRKKQGWNCADGEKGPHCVSQPKDYFNDLLGKRARGIVNRAHDKNRPFFLTLSSFAPHQALEDKPVFPAAMKDRPGGEFEHGDCGSKLNGERFRCLDIKVESDQAKLNKMYRDRVRMMQTLNDQLEKLRTRLREIGQLDNTYFVFTSDNGYHLDEHGLAKGKGTPYDHDTQVPLIIEGPGVKAGKVRDEITQTVDLYATFQQMANVDPKPSNGHGLLGLAKGEDFPHWRHAALFEHQTQRQGTSIAEDPDLDSGNVTRGAPFNPAFRTYKAIRTNNWLYVRYKGEGQDNDWLYDLRNDPGQTKNVIDDYPNKADHLFDWLPTYAQCGKQGEATCWKASHAPPTS